MDNDVKSKVSSLLNEAAKLLNNSNGSGTETPQQAPKGSSPSSSSSASSIQDTLRRASALLRESSSSGMCRRLKSTERLRATSSSKQAKEKTKNKKSEQKVLEFALLGCEEDEDFLKWDSVLASGILLLTEDDAELDIRRKIVESLQEKYPLLGENNFDFVKIRHKQIIPIQMGAALEYNYQVVKKMAGQGLLYLKVKSAYRYVYDSDEVDDEELEKSTFGDDSEKEVQEIPPKKSKLHSEKEVQEIPPKKSKLHSEKEDVQEDVKEVFPLDDPPVKEPSAWDPLVDYILEQELSDPVEILRFLQKELVQGRVIDAESDADAHDGVTNSICVDRHKLLETTFSELKSVECFNLTFEVDFMGEQARDLGGPRKEWIRLMNIAIKDKYFKNGLRVLFADDYYYVGVMMAIALLQNGQLPVYMPPDVIEQLATPSSNECIANIQRGLNTCGLAHVIQSFPVMLHLLRPSEKRLTPKILLHMLKPWFSEEGSSSFLREKEIYAMFIKYVRETGSGRRAPITLESILSFVTGASEEPVLGFQISPTIRFMKGEGGDEPPLYDYIPRAHTCTNVLKLYVGQLQAKLPDSSSLFSIYDMAFANTHFGTV